MSLEALPISQVPERGEGNVLGVKDSGFTGMTDLAGFALGFHPKKRVYRATTTTLAPTLRRCPLVRVANMLHGAQEELIQTRGINPETIDRLIKDGEGPLNINLLNKYTDIISSLLNYPAVTSLDHLPHFPEEAPLRYSMEYPYRDTVFDKATMVVTVHLSTSTTEKPNVSSRYGFKCSGMLREGAPVVTKSMGDGHVGHMNYALTIDPVEAQRELETRLAEGDLSEENIRALRKWFVPKGIFDPEEQTRVVVSTPLMPELELQGFFERGEGIREIAFGGTVKQIVPAELTSDLVYRAVSITVDRDSVFIGDALTRHMSRVADGSPKMVVSGECIAIVQLINYLLGRSRHAPEGQAVTFMAPLGANGPRAVTKLINGLKSKAHRRNQGIAMTFEDVMLLLAIYTVMHFNVEGVPPSYLLRAPTTYSGVFNALAEKSDELWEGSTVAGDNALEPILNSLSSGLMSIYAPSRGTINI